jgi:hypothetical protein
MRELESRAVPVRVIPADRIEAFCSPSRREIITNAEPAMKKPAEIPKMIIVVVKIINLFPVILFLIKWIIIL